MVQTGTKLSLLEWQASAMLPSLQGGQRNLDPQLVQARMLREPSIAVI